VGTGSITWKRGENTKLECVWTNDKPGAPSVLPLSRHRRTNANKKENVGVVTTSNGDRYEGGILCTATQPTCPVRHYTAQKHGEVCSRYICCLMLNYALQGQMMFADRSRYLGLFCNDMVNTVYSSIAVRISQNVILPLEIAGRIWSICFRRR